MIGWYVNDKQFGIIMGLIIAILITTIAIIILGHKEFQENKIKLQEERWNHGQCDNCGGEWKFKQAVGHCEDTTYLYICDDCLNTVEIGEYRGN